MPNLTLSQIPQPSPEQVRELINHLVAYNATQVAAQDHELLLFTLRDEDNRLLGGVAGHTSWGWLFISHLWLDDSLRGQGWGKRVLVAAEQEARSRGCQRVHLDTFSFQALDFYQSQGYQVFGQLDDYPVGSGHTRYFLTKGLTPVA